MPNKSPSRKRGNQVKSVKSVKSSKSDKEVQTLPSIKLGEPTNKKTIADIIKENMSKLYN